MYRHVEVLRLCQQKVSNGAPLRATEQKGRTDPQDAHLPQIILRVGGGESRIFLGLHEEELPKFKFKREEHKRKAQQGCEIIS